MYVTAKIEPRDVLREIRTADIVEYYSEDTLLSVIPIREVFEHYGKRKILSEFTISELIDELDELGYSVVKHED